MLRTWQVAARKPSSKQHGVRHGVEVAQHRGAGGGEAGKGLEHRVGERDAQPRHGVERQVAEEAVRGTISELLPHLPGIYSAFPYFGDRKAPILANKLALMTHTPLLFGPAGLQAGQAGRRYSPPAQASAKSRLDVGCLENAATLAGPTKAILFTVMRSSCYRHAHG